MTNWVDIACQAGFAEADAHRIGSICERECEVRTCSSTADLLRRIFLRLERDSEMGRGLIRALGVLDDTSLEQAARDFGLTKQYLFQIEQNARKRLGDLRVPRHEWSPAESNEREFEERPAAHDDE